MVVKLSLLVCFVLCICCMDVSFGQVASMCRPKERFLVCGGCQKTCRDPTPQCAGICRMGCYCNDDEVRDENGICVKLADCPPSSLLVLMDTSEPRPKGSVCPELEEYRFCEPCNKTCDQPNPICPAQCASGCFCKGDLVRDIDGKCVKVEYCQKAKNKTKLTCTENHFHLECQDCERTCSNPKPKCANKCARECICKGGLVMAPNGLCILLENCPQEDMMRAHEPSIKDCGYDEEFFTCGLCERTCSEPNPPCSQEVCIRGCLCRPPLLRHRDGRCVEARNCPRPEVTIVDTYKFSMEDCRPNEEFFTCAWCEPTCSEPKPECSKKNCIIGCLCRPLLLRHPTGACVEAKDCPRPEITIGAAHEPSIEDCGPYEEYFTCGWCEPTCSEPNPQCSQKVCIRGCLCRPPLLRHHTGACVESKNCARQKCLDPNEEFVCKYGCEARCDKQECPPSKPQRCRLGCYCKLGLLRDRETGKCIEPKLCVTAVTNSTSIYSISTKQSTMLSTEYTTKRARSRHSMPHHL